jgi:hypothetical protein
MGGITTRGLLWCLVLASLAGLTEAFSERVEKLVKGMTLADKIGQMGQLGKLLSV